jgi:hypothetical protein
MRLFMLAPTFPQVNRKIGEPKYSEIQSRLRWTKQQVLYVHNFT